MNIIDKRFSNQIKLAICIFPSDILKNEILAEKMTEYTRFYALRFNQILETDSTLDVHYASTIEAALEQYSDKYDHLLLMAAGVRIFKMDILFDIEQMILDNPNYFCAAHILDWKERWFELHHQFVLVNTQQWKKCGRPEYGGWTEAIEELPVIERSVENFHDDYTPLWIKFTGEYSQQRHQVQGWNFINVAARHDMEILNWPQHIRLKRTYYYPESQSDDFLNSLNTLDVTKITNPNQQRLIESCNAVRHQIWVINSEHMRFIDTEETYDTVVTTASGFKFLDAYHSNLLFCGVCRHCDESSKLIIYDFNPLSIAWVKYLHSSDNENIAELVETFEHRQHFKILGDDVFSSTGSYTKSFSDGLEITKEYFGGHSNFIALLRQFRQSRVEFILSDLYNASQELIVHFRGKTLFNISNIFCTDVGNAYYGMRETKLRYRRLLDSISVDCTIVGHDADCEQISLRINN
jgi:hypothetical protein